MQRSIAIAVVTGVLLAAPATVRAQADAASPGCGQAFEASTTTRSLVVDGGEREYVLVVPSSYAPDRPAPLVLTFHGSGSTPEQQLAISELPAAAEARGLIVAAPRAARPMPEGGFTWNVPPIATAPDDVAFTAAIIDDVAERLCLSRGEIYASGFSGGARLSSTLACELSERIAAIGAVGGLRHPAACEPARAVPVVAFHGTADPVNPYAGGGPDYWGHSVPAAFEGWAAAHGAGAVSEREAAAGVRRREYADASGEAAVVLYVLDGVGHVWPGSGFAFPVERLGPASDAIEATEIMLDFFAARRLR